MNSIPASIFHLVYVKLKNFEVLGNTYESEQQHTSKHASWLGTKFSQPC